MDLVPADCFTVKQLAEAYNQTRVDYIVPMPMSEGRLLEYIEFYDVDLSASCVAVDGEVLLGLGMLGVRGNRGWITRLGVLPSGRRQGTGWAITETLLASAEVLGLNTVWLEVIKGNRPALELFLKIGFAETRELVIARRPPNSTSTKQADNPGHSPAAKIATLHHDEALSLLSKRQSRPNWLIETESMKNVGNLTALTVEFGDGSQGWVTYHAGLLQLTHILAEVTVGDPVCVTSALLQILHRRHPAQDAVVENLAAAGPTWTGYQRAGYFDSFRRIEMMRTESG